MRVGLPILIPLGVIVALAAMPQRALADRIDGNWCYKTRHMTIDGPRIVTPGGSTMTGFYDRHGFEYTVPAGEADAGAEVLMMQFDDYTIEVTTTLPDGQSRSEIWNRCDLTT